MTAGNYIEVHAGRLRPPLSGMITSFIMHYPDENASPREDGDAIVFHDLGDGVSAILTK
jgi:hypothetical protein